VPQPSNDVDLTFHDNFEDHQAANDRPIVTVEEAQEVWYGGFHYRRNVTGRTTDYLVTGRTSGGRLVTVAVLWREDWGDWRAFNAWDTKLSDW
jgi:hypothetical protein